MSGSDDNTSAPPTSPTATSAIDNSGDNDAVTVETTLVLTQYVTAGPQTAIAIESTSSSALLLPLSTDGSSSLSTQIHTSATVSQILLTTSTASTSAPSTSTPSTSAPSTSTPSTSTPSASTFTPLYVSSSLVVTHSQPVAEATPLQTSQQQTPSATPTSEPVSTGSSSNTKQAIIGGLSGAIGAVVLFALFFCFCCLRRRYKRKRDLEHANQTPVRPILAPSWSDRSLGLSNLGLYRKGPSMRSSALVDGNLIRISLDRFERPFVEREGWRELMRSGDLRVMNPDPSTQTTPDVSTDGRPSFMSRSFTSLGRVHFDPDRQLHGTVTATKLPHILVDETPPKDCVVSVSETPSFRSYPSLNSSPSSRQLRQTALPVTTLEKIDEKPRRPTLAPLQGAASRTWSSITNLLTPVRTKSAQVIDHERPPSGYSSTYSTQSHPDTNENDVFAIIPPLNNATGKDNSAVYDKADSTPRFHFTNYDGT